MRTTLPLAFAFLVAGCATRAYTPGALLATGTLDAPAVTVGCLDVGVGPHTDPEVPVEHPAVRFDVGNRCLHGTRVDFGSVEAVGLYEDGWVPLHIRDPRGEVHAGILDGRAQLRQNFEFAPEIPRDRAPATVCFTLDAMTDGVSTAGHPSRHCIPVPVPDQGDVS